MKRHRLQNRPDRVGGTTPGRGAGRSRAAALTAASLIAGTIIAIGAPPVGAVTTAGLPTSSTGLVDGRAYEQVSPTDKNGYPIGASGQASTDGNAFAFLSLGAFAGQTSSILNDGYVASRSAAAWVTRPIALASPGVPQPITLAQPVAYTPDLNEQVVSSPLALTPGAIDYSTGGPFGYAGATNANLYRRDADGDLTLISGRSDQVDAADQPSYQPQLAGIASDLGHLVFFGNAAVTPGAAPKALAPSNLYDFTRGTIENVGILPGGSIAPSGAVWAGQGNPGILSSPNPRAISSRGDRIFFGASPDGTAPLQLYMRVDSGLPTAHTVFVAQSHRATPDPAGPQPAVFQDATADGSKVLFASAQKLTDDSTASPAGGGDLYLYDADTDALTDLTLDANVGDPAGADVQAYLGASSDLSVVYIQARGVLATGGTQGASNIYRLHNGATTFVADADSITGSRVASDGGRLAFTTTSPLTAYDVNDPVTSAPHREAYVYDAASDTIMCASCDPTGTPPRSDASIPDVNRQGFVSERSAAFTADGHRLFFQTADRLVPGAAGSRMKVYEYERGDGADPGGISLISGGASTGNDAFVDATPTGDDVFFTTRQRLVGTDTDDLDDLYDARVGGGQPAVVPAVECSGDACQGSITATPFLPPSGTEQAQGGAGGDEPAPVLPKPAFRVSAITSAQRSTIVRTGRVSLSVATTHSATVTVKATAADGRKTKTVGTGKADTPRAGTVKVTLRLSSWARSRLAKAGKLKVTFTVRATDVASKKTATVTLVRAKSPKGRTLARQSSNNAAKIVRATRKGA